MNETISNLLFIIMMFIGCYITSKIYYWIICLALASINSNAVYDNSSRQAILKLAKTNKIWKDVAKILKLESKGE